jgi:P27 family predicted phage terminase small subunit
VLDSSDRHLIELAAVCLGRLRQARAAIAKSGLEVRGDRGVVVAPAIRVELSTIRELRSLLSEIGLSPTARSRLGIEPPQESMADFLERTLGDTGPGERTESSRVAG